MYFSEVTQENFEKGFDIVNTWAIIAKEFQKIFQNFILTIFEKNYNTEKIPPRKLKDIRNSPVEEDYSPLFI